MALTLKLDDIKPLMSAVGLGETPAAPKPVDTITPPTPQGPPPPTPAAAGFMEWKGDPQNQEKIASGMTPPGTPMIPPSAFLNPPQRQFASLNPPALPPAPTQTMTAPPSMPAPAQPNVQELTLKRWEDQNPDKVAKPMFKNAGVVGNLLNFGAAGAIGAAGGLKGDPTAGARWVAEQAANDRQVPDINQARYNAAVIQPEKDAAALADTQSQTRQRNAAADLSSTKSDDMTPFTMTAEQAAAINQPTLAGTKTTQRDYSRLVGMAGNNNTSAANNTRTNDTKETTNKTTNDTKKTIADNANDRMKVIADAANKTKTLIAANHDATSRANNENTVANRGTNGAGGFKVPADVTKRASLAANVNENADAVEQLIQKRPDIIGASGGRYTNVQQMIGSNDPDIHELGVRMHNIALASNGAHGVRAQGAIQKTEDELFNNFKSGPQGIAGSLKATRGSMQTFLNDEQNFSTTGKRTGGGITPPPAGGGGGGVSVTAPDNSVHVFPNQAAADKFKKLAGIK